MWSRFVVAHWTNRSPCLKKETVWKYSTSRIKLHSSIPCPDRSDSVCAPMFLQQGGPGDGCLLSFTPAKSQNLVSERIGSTMAAVLYRPAFGESCIESQKSFWNSSHFIVILTFVFLWYQYHWGFSIIFVKGSSFGWIGPLATSSTADNWLKHGWWEPQTWWWESQTS